MIAVVPVAMRVGLAALSLLVASLSAAAIATAEPARDHTFSTSSRHIWSASGNGVVFFSDGTVPVDECTPGLRECDDTLIQVTTAGTLTAKVTGGDGSQVDVAIDLFESDASGRPGKQLQKGDGSTPTIIEQVSAELEPGFYLVRIDFLFGRGDVDVEAVFEALPVAAPAPGATPPPAANAAPKATPKVAKRIRADRLRGLGGTAIDDGAVAKVEVGLLQRRGRTCKGLTSSGRLAPVRSCSAPARYFTARGTQSWSLRLKRRLPKGSYTVFARATDDRGVVQPKPSTASFRVL